MLTPKMPLSMVFRRGAVFRQALFDQLDDPAYKDRTKPKYFVILSSSPLDDPIMYILTTSEKDKHEGMDYMVKLRGSYEFLPAAATLVDVSTAEGLSAPREDFVSLYRVGQIEYKGILSDEDTKRIIDGIAECPVVTTRFKQFLG